ncbi:MAG: YicC family protein [Spirochaetes bacterium GWD1_27_9]|nr:MAG: YicC family protein [Spirochaetes bacterium GWB1_27_13]OHD25181.1 MAG: YicC family protein [Spirochaetes bacterium GWC1_27_15]OHD31262.1 MAG: YicC family protein [Spirochaetes bacterium GWD1_27_9]
MNGMTGYSFKEFYENNVYISTEIKTVNHRFLEINIYLPYYLNSMEIPIKSLIQKKFRRGKVDINISLKIKDNVGSVDVNLQLAGQYIESLKKIVDSFNLKDDVKLFHLTRFDDIIVSEKKRDYSSYWDLIEKNINFNMEEIISMRIKEGNTTKKDLVNICENINRNIIEIEKNISLVESKIYENIKKKVTELIGNTVNEATLTNEVAIIVSRSCVNEELERLKMHLAEFCKIIDDQEDIGKKLDFICQEMHREINTLGSKIIVGELIGNVISIKNDIEKLREQIRNIE